jgi:ABC-type multidrug transport system ATPase subunit
MRAHRHRVLPRMNFTSPYVDLPKRLTVCENLRVFADLYGVRRARERIAAVAEDCDIAGLLKRPYGDLSAGQRTRVSLAKAVLNEPEVLLLDEPTASLDPDIGDRMRTYLEHYQHRTGCTMLLASHHMGEVERMCDDVIMLRAGLVVDQGSPSALIARYGRDNMEQGVPRRRARPRGRACVPGTPRARVPTRSRCDDDAARSDRYTGSVAALRRVGALVRRHAYLLLKSWPRVVSMAYYPTVTMVLWAFLTVYLAPEQQFPARCAGLLHRRGAAVGRAVPRPSWACR